MSLCPVTLLNLLHSFMLAFLFHGHITQSPGPAFSLPPAGIFCGITLPGSTTGVCTNMPFSTTLRAILFRICSPALFFLLVCLHTILCSLEEQNRQNKYTLNGGLLHGLTRYMVWVVHSVQSSRLNVSAILIW